MRTTLMQRPLLMLGAVVALLGASVAPAFAGTTTGEVGTYDMRDVESAEVVNCRYDADSNGAKLEKFLAKAPRAWWPDTNSDNDHQHGTVGWQVRIQQSSNEDEGPWTAVYKSAWQKRTAYEDQPFMDPADSASFSTRHISWNKSGATKAFRVIYVLRWFNGNGTTKGTAKHQVLFYKLTGDANGELIGSCPNRVFN